MPSVSFTADQVGKIVSPVLSKGERHNQPSIVNGYLLIAGNARFSLWDIRDPFAPAKLAQFESEFSDGEAESHQVALAKLADGRLVAATTSGRGIDLWNLSAATAPALLAAVPIDGIDYGDATSAVWGLAWQGRYVFVGGTNTGLHVIDAVDPSAPVIVAHLPTAALGGVSAGPVFALGNLLLVTTPKDHAGLATLDIGDPTAPALLDFELPAENSYIGHFFGRHAHLLTPFRTYDVTTDPRNIRLIGSAVTVESEYLSFGDGLLFLGGLRPDPGIHKIDASDPDALVELMKIEGRRDDIVQGRLTDDQFSLPVGNLLVMSDDQIAIGSVLAVHSAEKDSLPPEVLYVNPIDAASDQPITTRITLSFSDQIDLRTLDTANVIVRPLGGSALAGSFGLQQTLASFAPSAPLAPDTTYEIVVPAGGVRDLAGNALVSEHRSLFSTGALAPPPTCLLGALTPLEVGAVGAVAAGAAVGGASYAWSFGDGASLPAGSDPTASHAWAAPGRYPVTLTVTDGVTGSARSCSGVQIVHRALTPTRPTQASTLALDALGTHAWVVNPDADTVTRVDLVTGQVEHEVAVGDAPRTLALAPDGSLWVACHDSDEIAVLDGQSGGPIARIALGWGAGPHGVAFAPDGGRAWVTLESAGQLVELDVGARSVARRVDLGDVAGASAPIAERAVVPRVRALGITADSARVFVARFVSPDAGGEVYEVDAAGATLLRAIPLRLDPSPDTEKAGRGLPNYLASLALGPDGVSALVPSKKDNIERGLARDGLALGTDNTVRTVLSRIDLATGTEDLAARVDFNDHDSASAVAFSPLGDLVFVVSQGSNQLDVLDAYTGRNVGGAATGLAPQGVALAEGTLVVHSFLSRTIEIFDVAALLAGTDGAPRRRAQVTTVASEPLAPSVLLGKQIFYNADSPQMSLEGYVACATCHIDGTDDGRTWDFTDRGEGVRNTITLQGRAGTGHGPLHWTGNFDEVQDFEGDIRLHFGGSGFLSTADFESEDRANPLGGAKAGLSQRLDALADYVTSLDRFPRSPYRAPDGSFTEPARRGAQLFGQLGCARCHAGSALTDSALGVSHDVGTRGPASGQRLGAPLTGFDTPTLRGVWATAPYLHDGSARTLADVLANVAHVGSALSVDQSRDLVAFLRELENEPLAAIPGPQPAPVEPPPVRSSPSADAGCGCRSGSTGSRSAPLAAGVLLACLVLGRRRRPG